MFDSKRYSGVSRHKILIGVLCLLTLCVWARHTPDDQREHQRRTGGIRYGIQGPAAGSVELLIHLIS